MADAVNHPSHYNTGRIEVIDFIEDQHLGFHLGNVVKYICRSAHKGSERQDLEKAKWYLERKLSEISKGQTVGNQSTASMPVRSADTISGRILHVDAKP